MGCALLLERFGADSVDAFDLDPDMVARARRRLADRGDRVHVWVGDAEHIAAPDCSYAAVFDFGILHHVPDWRRALREIQRVLQPGGRFYAEEVLVDFLRNRLVQRLFDHPLHDRFGHDALAEGLRVAGLALKGSRRLWGGFGWYVADKVVA